MAKLAYSFTHSESLSALDRFQSCLPYRPSCGDDKACHLIRTRKHAERYPYIQPNPPQSQHWIILDLDYEELAEDRRKPEWDRETLFSILERESLPCPNFAVMNRHNRNCHIYFAIEPVCKSHNAKKQPLYYLDAVTRGLVSAFKADGDYTQRNAKNPLSSVWKTTVFHSDVYTLGELADYVELTSRPWFASNDDCNSESRNKALFGNLRQWAYKEVDKYRKHSTFEHWHTRVLAAAESFNHFPGETKGKQLPYSEIKATAKSVAKWTWTKYRAGGKDRGVMQLQESDLPLENRQRLAARRTHKLRTEETEKKLKSAIQTMKKRNERVTKSGAAKLAGISRQQVSSKYSHLFESPASKPLAPPKKNVFFGVHQVTADRFKNVLPFPLTGSDLGYTAEFSDLDLSVLHSVITDLEDPPPD